MQSYAQIIDTTLAIGDLASLGQRLRLPTGWIYRARVTVRISSSMHRAKPGPVQDNLENTYQRLDNPR
jgi:hypothetical protein